MSDVRKEDGPRCPRCGAGLNEVVTIEPSQVDVARKVWVKPHSLTKQRRISIVPLQPEALAIAQQVALALQAAVEELGVLVPPLGKARVVHLDHVGRFDELQAVRVDPGRAEEDDLDPFRCSLERARDDLVRRPVASHRVDRYARTPLTGVGSRRAEPGSADLAPLARDGGCYRSRSAR